MYIYIYNKISAQCFHRFVHFDCGPIYNFGFHHKQRASDYKEFTLVKFSSQLTHFIHSCNICGEVSAHLYDEEQGF